MSRLSVPQEASYQLFSFLELDNKLNVRKIEQNKKQQHNKNVLNVYKKKLPNLQLVKQCNKIIHLYKNHYNINRRFSIFHQTNNQKIIENQEVLNSKNRNTLPTLELKRYSSSHNFSSPQKNFPAKSLSIIQAQRIMKPIKTNQYLNQKGFVKLSDKLQSQNTTHSSSYLSTKNAFTMSEKLRTNFHKNLLTLSKDQNLNQNSQNPLTKKALPKNNSTTMRQRKKQLKKKFRKNIFLIVDKIKRMKVTMTEIIQNKIFDKSTAYKFGEEIFHAVKQGDQSKVFRIILKNRLSIFGIDTTGKSTLMWACIRGYDQIVELLLSNGVAPHWRDINGKTALYFAIKFNHAKCAQNMFLYSQYLEPGIQYIDMSQQMRRMVRIGLLTHSYLNRFKNIGKKKEQFEQQYRYYFKE